MKFSKPIETTANSGTAVSAGPVLEIPAPEPGFMKRVINEWEDYVLVPVEARSHQRRAPGGYR